MGETVISIKDLSKSFGNHEVLRKIDIDIEAGEIICIVVLPVPESQRCCGVSINWSGRPR